jgi:hypothetical protein
MSFSPSNFLANFSAESQAISCLQKTSQDLLIRPWLICFVARASTANNSTIILIIISVIAGVGWISV